MDKINSIKYGDLPRSAGGFSQLYCDYVADFQKVQQYYETDYNSPNIPMLTERIRQQIKHRSLLVEVLIEQNQKFGASDLALEHVKLLGEENTFAVVTGQQVGILGGPLYTIYKTITAIKLAAKLNASHPEYKFVPVFWLEGEDHDYEEINKVGLLNHDHLPIQTEFFVKGKSTDKNLGSTGEILLNENLQSFYEDLQKNLQNSEFKKPLIDLLQSTYTPGATFNIAFASLMNKFFADAGLVFISSNDKRLKQLLAPIFLKEIQEYPRVSQFIIKRSAELESRYHAQIKTKALNLFMFYKGGRYLIEPREKDFSLKGLRQYFQKEELIQIATETPELLSPNVALRPICQDTILPTIAYVGGPSEIAYFAQLKSVYKYFDLSMPIIYPRASATIVEEKIEKILEKYELGLTELFDNSDRVRHKIIEMISEVKVDDMFTEALTRINDLTNEMKFGLNYIDSTLLGTLETTRTKIESQFLFLKEKVIEAQTHKHEIALRQIDKAINSLFPNANFQERELSVIYFMNKYGLDFVKYLTNELQIDKFMHQIIHM